MDTQIFYLLNALAGQSPLLDAVIVFFATYLAYILIGVFLIFVYLSQNSWRQKLDIVVVALIATALARGIITELIRYFYNRPRPFDALTSPAVNSLFLDPAWSFPSGHATFFFALSTVVYLYNRKWGIGFYIATVLITVGRVAAGVHYPSDILGGAIIGSGIAYLTYSLSRAYLEIRAHTTY